MEDYRILEELVTLLETAGVTIRREPLGGEGGGICTVKGEHIFFIDTQARSADMADIGAQAVAKIVDTDNIYILPIVRQFIEEHSD